MRKIAAIILSVMFIMCMVVSNVSAAEFSQENITVTVTGYTIEVSVTAGVGGRMSAHLFNEDKDNTLSIDYNDAPEVNNGVYTYRFTFGFGSNVPTSKFYVRVGNNVPATEKMFNYASVNDKNTFFNELSALEDAASVENYLKLNKQYTSVDIAAFEEISSNNVRGLVSENINVLNLATGYENRPDEDEEYIANKLNALTDKERLFNETFSESMKYAMIADANETKWPSLANNAIAENLFDCKYFVSSGATNSVLTVQQVYPYFAVEVAKMSVLSQSEITKAFDRATLMAAENEMAPGTIKEVFLYFKEKGTIAVSDMTNINALISSDNDADFWRTIKAGTYIDCDDMVSKIVSEAENFVGSGNSSGSTGGATGSNDATNSTSPGGFSGGSLGGGGGSAKPTTPAEPKPDDGESDTSNVTFSDVANVDWAKDSIEALAEQGVLNGKGDGKFYPNDSVTREEFIKIIVAAFDLADEGAKHDFADVSVDSWSYPYIAAAAELGIVSGDGANFNPTSDISRQDMAVIIHRVFEHLGLEVSGTSITFDDNSEISEYASDAVDALTAAGIINGMGDGTFAPSGTVTRAQAAKVVFGLMQLVGGGK